MTNNPNELTIENSALRKVSSVARTTTITLGGDLQVGRIGYGAMRLTGTNGWGEYADRDGGIALLRQAVEAGVTLIDTADVYGPHTKNEKDRTETVRSYDRRRCHDADSRKPPSAYHGITLLHGSPSSRRAAVLSIHERLACRDESSLRGWGGSITGPAVKLRLAESGRGEHL